MTAYERIKEAVREGNVSGLEWARRAFTWEGKCILCGLWTAAGAVERGKRRPERVCEGCWTKAGGLAP